MQKKGIIMQVANSQAIVLTKDREFMKIPLLDGMAIGQEVDVPAATESQKATKKSRWFNTPWKQTGAVAACVLLAVGLWSSSSLLSQPKAYAYVTVDINPSIELAIDNHQKVIAASALNSDGEQVLHDLKLDGKQVEDAVESVAEFAQNKGLLQNQAEVLITASSAKESGEAVPQEDLNKIEDTLVAKVKTVASTHGNAVDVEGIVVSQSVRAAAKDAGVSPGKYAVYLSAQSSGVDVDLDELKKQSIRQAVEQKGTDLANVVHQIQGGKHLDSLLDAYKQDGKEGLKKAAEAIGQDANKGITAPQSPSQPQSQSNRTTPPGQAKKDDSKPAGNKDDSKGKSANDREKSDKGANNTGSQNGNGHSNGKSDDRGNSGKGDSSDAWHLNWNWNHADSDKKDSKDQKQDKGKDNNGKNNQHNGEGKKSEER